MKDKFSIQFQAVADDSKSSKLVELQNRLDEMHNNGMTAMTMRDVLFQKCWIFIRYQVIIFYEKVKHRSVLTIHLSLIA